MKSTIARTIALATLVSIAFALISAVLAPCSACVATSSPSTQRRSHDEFMNPHNEPRPSQPTTSDKPMLSHSVRVMLWLGVVAALLAVFAFYGQLELALRWVEMKLC